MTVDVRARFERWQVLPIRRAQVNADDAIGLIPQGVHKNLQSVRSHVSSSLGVLFVELLLREIFQNTAQTHNAHVMLVQMLALVGIGLHVLHRHAVLLGQRMQRRMHRIVVDDVETAASDRLPRPPEGGILERGQYPSLVFNV
jgi:hypothetical protein